MLNFGSLILSKKKNELIDADHIPVLYTGKILHRFVPCSFILPRGLAAQSPVKYTQQKI
jgi:hypothetical protein